MADIYNLFAHLLNLELDSYYIPLYQNKENPAVLSYTLTGEFNGKKLKYKLEGDLNNITAETFEAKDLPIHRLAAKAQIKELEDNDGKECIKWFCIVSVEQSCRYLYLNK